MAKSLLSINFFSNSLNFFPNRYATLLPDKHKFTQGDPIVGSNLTSDNCKADYFIHENISHTASPTTVNAATRITKRTTTTTTTTTTMVELEKKRNIVFWLRKWDSLDVTNACYLGVAHVLAICAPFVFDWGAFGLAIGLFLLTGQSLTFCYHRLLSHRSFKVPKWLEYFSAYCASHAMQRDPIFWVSIHRYHHQHTDTEDDPHTPRHGFLFSHMGWILHNDYIATMCGESKSGECSNVPDLKKHAFYRFLHETYVWHIIAIAALLYICGGFPYLAWGMGMRVVVLLHITFFVNSVCHIWGERRWKTLDTSANNWWVALLSFGEGWHNNHHAFPTSARQGLEWWQLDITWWLISFLESVGLATDVKLPTEAQKTRMAIA